ncbi:MAG: HDIG domain-containing protein [Candidatus Aegiribacteria sp.]|nr:HDIG domain-containing protein [Candidatus Aegiribacteria sp.]
MINREKALELLEQNLSNRNLIRHCLAAEAVMRTLAEDRGEDTELWGITGLLHDLDYELTENDHAQHALVTAGMLEGQLPEEAIQAIKSHNYDNNGVERSSDFDYLLAAGESITGLIVAVALVYPDKKIQPVKLKSVLKRMNMTAFARSVPRETIRDCSKAGYELDEFVRLSLEAMKEIASDIGL